MDLAPRHQRKCRVALAAILVTIAVAAVPFVAQADETLKLAVGAPNNWDSGLPDIGKRAGIFQKHGLDLDILYTNGGGETLQAVISGSVDIGVATGTASVLGAFAKGAPVRITWRAPPARATSIGMCRPVLRAQLQRHGRQDDRLFHHRRVDPHTLLALIKHFGVAARPVATGAAAVTMAQAMSGTGRCRLGVAAVRSRCPRGRPDPPDRARQRCALDAR